MTPKYQNQKHQILAYFFILILLFFYSCNAQNRKQQDNQLLESSQNKWSTLLPFSSSIFFGKKDVRGNLWFGTVGDGLYLYSDKGFRHFDQTSGLHNNKILCMAESEDGVLWFGTDDGLTKYEKGEFQHIPIPFSDTIGVWMDKVYPVINPNAVHSLLMDKNGDLWVGTCGAGVYRYDGNNFSSYLTEVGIKMDDSLHHNWISSMIEDEQGNLWFSSMSRGGVMRFDGKSFKQYLPKNGLFSDMVRTIFEDHSGNIWFGYKARRDGGLTKYDGNTFTNYFKSDGLCNHSVRNIFEDHKGNLWLAGDLNFLCVYDGINFTKFTSKSGESFTDILFTLEDKNNNIWFGGKNGLWKYDGEEVESMSN